MENFSTVLWIVVIAAAMIFNVVSQSRKQAKKQARQAGDRHAGSEAWPSWDPAAGPQPDSREDTPVRQEVQPAVAPGATPTMAPSAGFEDAAPAAGSGHTAPLSGRSDVQKGRMTATEHPHAAYDDAPGGCYSRNNRGFRPAQGRHLFGDTQAKIRRITGRRIYL